ncbi:hypothetical protein A3A36_01335 [Candidatus Kaiserbacteria bacterium RIFCSPLOWO2_01_FULL_52_12b]|uniref:Uncharacterized protein n=1 Tax=Candidatus Kaiserbacteria bacterium RIFCSPLOWO2_01_FULL_52_12b TaxID=1798509 RepID=A0A1F6EW67_9BACT|nr:MAG: hypothetical protein A3A36_01335 [Candidatus Kaiserbacteria bacterium RIFCSPLOWO2_01_FULL_52_12b]
MDTNAATPTAASDADPPKKYIRTFEGDIQTLKEGGVPDLALLKESEHTEPKTVEHPAAPPPPVVPVPAPPLEPKPEPVPIPLPPSKPVPVPAPQKPEPVKPVPLQTYEGDFSDRMKDTHASMATVLAAEQDSATGAPRPTPPKSAQGGRVYIIIGVLLLIFGIGGAYYAYTRYTTALAPVDIQSSVSAPIFVDDREQISGTGSLLSQAIKQSVARPLAANTVRLLSLASATTSNDSVFSALRSGAPDMLVRNVNTRGSMAGVVSAGGSQSPFFILSVASYSDTFAGMLSWEPLLVEDMETLYPPRTPPVVSTTTVATTTIPTAVPRNFRDEIVSNHDVRVYRDAFGQSILLYGYWNKTTLVIARDSSAFIEIINRLATSRTAP